MLRFNYNKLKLHLRQNTVLDNNQALIKIDQCPHTYKLNSILLHAENWDKTGDLGNKIA